MPAICEFQRLGRVGDSKLSRPPDLLVTALRVAAHPFKLKIDKAQIIATARYVRTQAQNPVLGCRDAGNLDGSRVSPGYRPLETMLDYFARLHVDESVREILIPSATALIRLT